jgi:hypothetical protein
MPLISYVRLPQTNGYSYPRVVTIQINVHHVGENSINTTRTLPTPVNIRPTYASCRQSPYVATFHESSIDLDKSYYSREKGLLTQSIPCWLTDPCDCTQFLCQANQWSSRLKPSFYWWQATRLTGPISPDCDRYVQYLLTGVNLSVLNWHRRGLQPCRCRLANTTRRPSQLTVLHFSPNGLARSQVIHRNIFNWNKEGTNPKSHEWDFSTRLLPLSII